MQNEAVNQIRNEYDFNSVMLIWLTIKENKHQKQRPNIL